MARVLDSVPIRIGVEVVQSNVQTERLFSRFSFLRSFYVHNKLNIVAIGTSDDSHPVDWLKLIEVQITSPPHLEATRPKLIGERDGVICLQTASTLSPYIQRWHEFGSS
jgi:hypothetical protein